MRNASFKHVLYAGGLQLQESLLTQAGLLPQEDLLLIRHYLKAVTVNHVDTH